MHTDTLERPAHCPFVDVRTLEENPHEALASLRRQHSIVQIAERQYVALRAEDGFAMLTDPRMKQVEGHEYLQLNQVPDGAMASLLKDILLFDNGSSHRAKRGLFSRAFAHGTMRSMRRRVREVADEIVAELPRGELFDFVERMAGRVPAELIAGILGLPTSDASYFAPFVYDVAKALAPIYPHEDHASIETGAAELVAYVKGELRERLAMPRDDLLSTVVADWQGPGHDFVRLSRAPGRGDPRGRERHHARRICGARLPAPGASPRLGNGEVRSRARPGCGRRGDALRAVRRLHHASDGRSGRDRRRDAAGRSSALRVSTMSAMRDPALYDEPDRFKVARSEGPRLHPVFGGGAHRCIGEMLARIEMEEGLAALIAGAPDIVLEKAPRMLGFGGIRQITPMLVRIP